MINVVQIMPLFELAGAQTMCENLSLELKKDKNINCTILTFFNNDCEIVNRLKENGIDIICLNKHKGFDIKIIFKLAYYFRKLNPDVIHTHLSALQYVYFAYLLQKNKKNIKIIHTIHNEADKENKRYLRKLQGILFKKNIVTPVAISKTIKKSIISEYSLNDTQVPIVYNSIDLKKCIPKKENEKFTYNFINIGRLTEQKNQIELIRIFKKIHDEYSQAKLTIVGSGPLKLTLEDEISREKLDSSVNLVGNLDSCYDILNKSDLFLMTSKFEGLPMTIIEAMGTGIPIVSYDAGGIKDIITNGKDGFIAKNDIEFISDVKKIIENGKLRNEIRMNELEDSKAFNSASMAKKYKDIYMDNREKKNGN